MGRPKKPALTKDETRRFREAVRKACAQMVPTKTMADLAEVEGFLKPNGDWVYGHETAFTSAAWAKAEVDGRKRLRQRDPSWAYNHLRQNVRPELTYDVAHEINERLWALHAAQADTSKRRWWSLFRDLPMDAIMFPHPVLSLDRGNASKLSADLSAYLVERRGRKRMAMENRLNEYFAQFC